MDRDVSHTKILGKQMLAGGLAGMLADGVMYPMMTVKSRLMVCTAYSFFSFFFFVYCHIVLDCILYCSWLGVKRLFYFRVSS